MSSPCPSPSTGTAQDLMRVITRAYEARIERERIALPRKSPFSRRWLEPAARLFGIGAAKLASALPPDWDVALHDLFYSRLAGRRYPFDAEAPALRRAAELAARLERETGRAPALVAAISHPPVLGELAHLNFELVRQATLALRAARGRPCRPRLVVAVDPFALDTASLAEEGIYAGYMGSLHLGLDRLVLRDEPGPRLSPGTAWHAMPWRMLRLLAGGGEVGIVLSGGVPDTGRVLYGAREWVREARAPGMRRAAPAQAAARLEREPGFAAFAEGSGVPLPRGVWRRLEGWLMAAAAGLLPQQPARAVAKRVLDVLDVRPEARPGLLSDLDADLRRETPRRLRLFRALAGRVARRRPLVLIPVVHRVEPLGVEIREAWSWKAAGPGRALGGPAGAEPREDALESHAWRFVEGNFA